MIQQTLEKITVDDATLIGQTVESLKQGKFYYTFPNGTKQFAGVYEGDLKEGSWQDYIGKRFVASFYVKGVRQPLLGTIDQQGKRNGYWIEKCGISDQLITSGNYQNNIRIGTWSTYFEGLKIEEGNYNEQGIKVGKWTEASEKYDRLCRLTSCGEYNDGLKVGMWISCYKNQQIGCGNYENGQKCGPWIDIDENFKDQHQIFHEGQYKNDLRVGKWKMIHEDIEIGGGHYDDNGLKQGQWKESDFQFNTYMNYKMLISQSGEYIDNKKIGKWIIASEKNIMGGGQYDEKGLKQGQWIEFADNQHESCGNNRYSGEYINGVKNGQWKILNNLDLEIGGGNYDDQGLKQGLWTDVNDNYRNFCRITFAGEYKDGIRISNWKILKDEDVIGEGNYTEQGIKQGKWTDLHENYYEDCEVLYIGEYNNGIRTGLWIIKHQDDIIGQGNYDEEGIKSGQWSDLHDTFRKNGQVILKGEYKHGVRNGKWLVHFYDDIIGGGTFDEKGLKQGQWTQLHSYDSQSQVMFSGIYSDDLATGNWIISYKNKEIGGGLYENGVKQGQWTDIHDKFQDFCQVTYSGQYLNGKQIGNWTISLSDTIIGGGNYNDDGFKQGLWNEILENEFNNCQEVKYQGEYNNGLRIGQWKIMYKSFSSDEQMIGGGQYNNNGKKNGLWVDFDKKFDPSREVTYQGEYKNGIQIGKWTTLFKDKEIGGGTFDDDGQKQGQWTEIDESFNTFSQETFIGEYQNGQRIGEWVKQEKKQD